MSLVDVLAGGLPLTAIVNWLTFGVAAVAARRHPDVRSLTDRFWLSLGIAVLSTSLVILALTYFIRLSLGLEINALLLSAPVYALTAVNLVFLYLTMRGRW